MRNFISKLFRGRPPSPTIAPARELKQLIKEGKAVPYPTTLSAAEEPIKSWLEIMQIPDPLERYLKLGDYVSLKGIKQGYNTLTDSEKIVYQIWILETEVNNGGFDQFFFNSSGDLALETLETLRLIGSIETTNLLKHAIEIIFEEQKPSPNQTIRWEQMEPQTEEQEQRITELDNHFYSLTEKTHELVVNYLDSVK